MSAVCAAHGTLFPCGECTAELSGILAQEQNQHGHLGMEDWNHMIIVCKQSEMAVTDDTSRAVYRVGGMILKGLRALYCKPS